MATSTEVAIATTTLGSAASTITFSSIPSTYTDLRLVLVGTTSADGVYAKLSFNNDSGTNYSRTLLQGDGTSATSSAVTSTGPIASGKFFITLPTMATADIFSYAGSTYKTSLNTWAADQNGSGIQYNAVILWRSTSAINRIDLSAGTDTFKTGFTATLYGIL